MFKLLQVFQQSITEGPGVYSTSTHLWEIIIILLGTAILGYLLGYFTKPKTVVEPIVTKTNVNITPDVNEWEVKYKSFHTNYEQNKLEWSNKLKSSEDRVKTFKAQVTDLKSLFEKASGEKADWASKLRVMEGQRNEANEEIKNISTKLVDTIEASKNQQEKIGSLSAALAKASNQKVETPKPIIISDEELTKKYDADTATYKKQVDEKDNRIISLLSKEAAAAELQLRNDKLATENRILRDEMSVANMDSDIAITRALKQKELELNIVTLSNKAVITANEATSLKTQLADQQSKQHVQANKLNELRMAIGRERNAMKIKIEELEAELAPFKPAPAVIEVPKAAQAIENIAPILSPAVEAPSNEQMVTQSPEIDATPVPVPEALALPIMEVSPTSTSTISPIVAHQNMVPTTIEPDKVAESKPEMTPVGPQDEIQVVEGIGPKVGKLLKHEGIDTWAKLAAAKPLALKDLLAIQSDENFHSISPNSWPIQAQLLMDGKWDAFKAYSTYLIGGVDPDELDATPKTDSAS